MKKTIVRLLITSLIIVVVFIAFQVIRGMYLTVNYVPDMTGAYESVDFLEHKVAFGYILEPMWGVYGILGLVLIGIIVIYMARALKRKKRSDNLRNGN